jgi:hypothetical protein
MRCRSVLLNIPALSCMSRRSSSRLAKSRPVRARPPVTRSSQRANHSTIVTIGESRKSTTWKGRTSRRHSRFGNCRKSVFGSSSQKEYTANPTTMYPSQNHGESPLTSSCR